MSLKWFHVFFITMSIVMAVAVAVWAVRAAEWPLALVALASGAMLIVYRELFLRKTSKAGLQ